MGLLHSPKIVTDGLICCVDAANPRSYDGVSTVWNDLSHTRAVANLINGPTFDSENGGSIVLDGINDYLDFGSYFTSISTYTFSIWLNFISRQAAEPIVSDDSDENNLMYVLEVGKIYFTTPGEGFKSCDYNTINTGQWINFVFTRGSTNTEIYQDSELLCQQAKFNNNVHFEWIARGYGTPQYINIKVSSIHIYNRSLTAQEIKNNYDSMKGRLE